MAESGQNGVISWNRYGYKWRGEGPFQRVTTLKSKKSSGNALVDWAAKMVAEKARAAAIDCREGRLDADELIVLLMGDSLSQAHNEKRDAAADFGTVFHSLVEYIAAGDGDALHVAEEEIRQSVSLAAFERANPKAKDPSAAQVRVWFQLLPELLRNEIEMAVTTTLDRLFPDVEAFLDWEGKAGIKWIRNEFQVFHRGLNYAGSVDALVEIGGHRYLLDVKTSKGVYKDYGLQLAAYRYAEFVGEPDGTESEMPEVEGGLILHVHGGRCQLLEIACGPAQFEAFRGCKLLYDFDRHSPEPREWQPKLELVTKGEGARHRAFA